MSNRRKTRPAGPPHPTDGHDARPMTDPVDGITVSRALRADGSSSSVLVPSFVSGLSEDGAALVGDLQRAALHLAELHGEVRAMVAHARQLGVSWRALGWALGLSADGVRMRYGVQR